MPELVTEMVGGEPYEYYPLGQYIVRAPGVCRGRPTFKYTRIEMTFILNILAAGTPVDQILKNYGGRISLAAIQEAMTIVNSYYMETMPELMAVA